MKDERVLIEDWVLEMLWKDFPWGAAKGELSEGEMRGHIRRWEKQKEDKFYQKEKEIMDDVEYPYTHRQP